MTFESIKNKVGNYYSGKLLEFGATPKGVDWKNEESQLLRFEQLLKIVDAEPGFKLLDFGCGYGSLFELMQRRFPGCNYTGFDISQEMIDVAKNKFRNSAEWTQSLPTNSSFDYVIASGIFNVKLETDNDEWLNYILDTLETINRISTKGFSFNALTKYSDAEYMRKDLYYADPGMLFDCCKKKFSRYVSLLHDYPLYEFTILVKKIN